MDNLDKQLRELSKISPPEGFIRVSKKRLMQQIHLQQSETWFRSLLRRIGIASPRQDFLELARLRILHQISRIPAPVRVSWIGVARTLITLKRAVASTLVMMIAVTATLFFVEGNTLVEASDDSYLEIVSGSAAIKHADLIAWENINGQIEVQSGDLIKVNEGSQATVHFFDDSELRLDENSVFLISKLAVSSSFSRQAVVEVSLHEGRAWVQTLNVEDGSANFSLVTRNAHVSTVNGSYSVSAGLTDPTQIYAIKNKLELTTLEPDTRKPVASTKVAEGNKVTVHSPSGTQAIYTISKLSEQDLATPWFQSNLEKDHEHLTALREGGLERLSLVAGSLPGDMLYPIKQAKERLMLAFSSNENLDVKIEIANRRLNEAIVLFESGEIQRGREALMAYQSMARQIAETKAGEDVTNQLIVPHRKALTTELPNDASVTLIKDTLHETAEILAEGPIEKEKIRLQNSIERLQDIIELAQAGDFEVAKERLIEQQLSESSILSIAENLEDEEVKKALLQEVLELREEELNLLATLTDILDEQPEEDESLLAVLESATQSAEDNLDNTLALAIPLIPELAETQEPELSAVELRIAELVDKIYIYDSWDGQQNQIERLLKYELQDVNSIDFLIQLRDALTGRAYDYLNVKILQLRQKEEYLKGKTVQRKIDQAIKLRLSTESS